MILDVYQENHQTIKWRTIVDKEKLKETNTGEKYLKIEIDPGTLEKIADILAQSVSFLKEIKIICLRKREIYLIARQQEIMENAELVRSAIRYMAEIGKILREEKE